MSSFTMKLPDVGEGVAEAEIVEWLVAVGDEVTPDSALAEVLTDKATVEVSSPVSGVVVALHGEPGDVVAVGGDLVEIDTGDESPPGGEQPSDAVPDDDPTEDRPTDDVPAGEPATDTARADDRPAAPLPPPSADRESSVGEGDRGDGDADGEDGDDAVPARRRRGRALAAPAVRARADRLGIDLASIVGSGPDGRVVHDDLDRLLGEAAGTRTAQADDGRARPIRGVRRRIAARLGAAWSDIPHITYVEATDVTELERLRTELNAGDGAPRLTLLPFLARALVLACGEHPGLNAHYDHAAETLTTFDAVHVGIATQTDIGLMVPVVRHAESRSLDELAREIDRVTSAARSGSAARDELSGSTITITSLGALGGVATTPIINPPEVAIVGVNKIEMRPVWLDGAFVPRQVMNLSSSFDHRMVDGWDAAVFVQSVKRLLETPALLFVDR